MVFSQPLGFYSAIGTLETIGYLDSIPLRQCKGIGEATLFSIALSDLQCALLPMGSSVCLVICFSFLNMARTICYKVSVPLTRMFGGVFPFRDALLLSVTHGVRFGTSFYRIPVKKVISRSVCLPLSNVLKRHRKTPWLEIEAHGASREPLSRTRGLSCIVSQLGLI